MSWNSPACQGTPQPSSRSVGSGRPRLHLRERAHGRSAAAQPRRHAGRDALCGLWRAPASPSRFRNSRPMTATSTRAEFQHGDVRQPLLAATAQK